MARKIRRMTNRQVAQAKLDRMRRIDGATQRQSRVSDRTVVQVGRVA